MPAFIAVIGYVVGGILILVGIIGFWRRRKRPEVAKRPDELDVLKVERDKITQERPAAIKNSGTIRVGGNTEVNVKGNANGIRNTDGGTFETDGQLKVNKEEQQGDDLKRA